MAKRVSIINFKGGVGKTALSLHLAVGLSLFHNQRVLLVDVDHQSSLSLICLKGEDWKRVVNDGKTVNAIFEHFIKQNTPLPGKDIIYEQPYGEYPNLDLIPATLQLDEIELDLTSTVVGDPIKSEWNKRTLICRWIGENAIDEDYDYIIFDCPPATKLVTQNAIAASHGFIVPVIPDAVSTRGVPHLVARVLTKIDGKLRSLAGYLEVKGDSIPNTYVPETKLVGIVINMIRKHGPAYSGYIGEHTRHLEALKRMFPDDIVEPYIPYGAGVLDCLSRRYPVYKYPRSQNVRTYNYDILFEELTSNLKKRIDEL